MRRRPRSLVRGGSLGFGSDRLSSWELDVAESRRVRIPPCPPTRNCLMSKALSRRRTLQCGWQLGRSAANPREDVGQLTQLELPRVLSGEMSSIR